MSRNRRSREFKNNSRVIDMEEARRRRHEKRRAERAEAEEKDELARKEKTRGKKAIRRKRNRRRFTVALIVLAACLVVGYSAYNIISLKMEQREVYQQQQALKEEKKELEEELENINDPENLEEQARDQLRLVKPGETLYMFPDEMTDNSDASSDEKD